MRELFESCKKKIQFFNFFWSFLNFEGGEFSQKRCKIVCSDVSGTTWKILCLSPEKMTIFPPVPSKNVALSPTLKLLF